MGEHKKPGFGGAKLERGIIQAAGAEGYTVSSYDRPGIIGKGIRDILGNTHAAGDKVYWFFYPDGTGIILCEM